MTTETSRPPNPYFCHLEPNAKVFETTPPRPSVKIIQTFVGPHASPEFPREHIAVHPEFKTRLSNQSLIHHTEMVKEVARICREMQLYVRVVTPKYQDAYVRVYHNGIRNEADYGYGSTLWSNTVKQICAAKHGSDYDAVKLDFRRASSGIRDQPNFQEALK